MNREDVEIVARALTKVAGAVYGITPDGWWYNIPPPDFANRIAFAVTTPKIDFIVSDRAVDRNTWHELFTKVSTGGLYATWRCYERGWFPSTISSERNDLRIIIYTEFEKQRLSSNVLSPNCHIISSTDPDCREKILAAIKKWVTDKLT
jgi:hypothetical protein